MGSSVEETGSGVIGTRNAAFERPHDGFLFAGRGNEGLVVRAQPTNRVFYSPDVEAAKEVVDRVVAVGLDRFAREEAESADPQVREQWLSMAQAGFFANVPSAPIPLYNAVFEMAEGDNLVQAVGMLFVAEGVLRRRVAVELRVREAGDIAPAWERLQGLLRAWRGKAGADGGAAPAAQASGEGGASPPEGTPAAGGQSSTGEEALGTAKTGPGQGAQVSAEVPRRGQPPRDNYPQPAGQARQNGKGLQGEGTPPGREAERPVTVATPLLGKGEPDERLLALLDQEKIAIMYLHEPGASAGGAEEDASSGAEGASAEMKDGGEPGEADGSPSPLESGPPALAAFEEMGYLFPMRIACSPEAVADPGERLMVIREVDRILQETPNREIDLVVERPARFARLEDVDPYYGALEAFLTDLYRINADPSRLTPFARYIEGVLANRFHPNRLRLRLEGEGLHAGFHSTRTPFAVVPPTRQEVRGIADYLNDLIGNNTGLEVCADCAFGFICPKAQSEPYLYHVRRVGEREIAARIYQRECALHRRIFPLVFEDLIRQASPHVPDGTPLRLDITDDRQLAFRPRDGGEEEGGRMKPARGRWEDEAGPRQVEE